MADKKPFKLKNVAIRMVAAPPIYSSEQLRTPNDVAALLSKELRQYDREVMCVVNFKSNMQPINMNIVSMGTIDATLVSPREVFKTAILSNAAQVMLVHNHPSGRAVPSRMDDVITQQLKGAADIMGIPLIDHIIIGDGAYYSYRENRQIIEEKGKEVLAAEDKPSIMEKLGQCQDKAKALGHAAGKEGRKARAEER